MKKLLTILLCSIFFCFAAQSQCAVAMCSDTITSAKDTLGALVPTGTTSVSWQLIHGRATITNPNSAYTSATGMVQGDVNVFQVTATGPYGSLTSVTTKTWLAATVTCPPPPAQRTVSSISCVGLACTIKYNDGSTQPYTANLILSL